MKASGWIVLVLTVAVCGGGTVALNQFRAQQMAKADKKPSDVYKVAKGAVNVQVIETGKIDAVRVVELKSRVAGKVLKLYKDVGDLVIQGELVAIIDPQETKLQVEQNRAQLRGAQASVRRSSVEIEQRRVTARTNLAKAESRVRQLEAELKTQPTLTGSTIKNAEAALASSKSQLNQLVKVTHPNETTSIKAEVEQADATYVEAMEQLNRVEGLFADGFAAKREVDAQKLQVELARSRRDSARDRLGRLRAQQDAERAQAEQRVRQAESEYSRALAGRVQDSTKLEDLRQARLQVEEARAALRDVDALMASRDQSRATVSQISSSLADSERQLRETEIRAPFGGIITERPVQLGELVSSLSSFSNGSVIAKLEDRSTMLLKLQVNEIDVAKLSTGMAAEVEVDAFPGKSFPAKITKIAPTRTAAAAGAQSSTDVVRYDVEIRLETADGSVKSGMTAKAKVDVVESKTVLRIPIEFLEKKGNDFIAYVVATENDPISSAKKVTIETGSITDAYVEVKGRVREGDLLKKPPFTGPDREGMGRGRGRD